MLDHSSLRAERPRHRLDGKHLLLGAGFILAGIVHFVLPAPYVSIMPAALPQPLALVYLSGVAEVIGGIGMLVPATRRPAGIWLILLLLAVFPANMQMLINWRAEGVPAWKEALAWLRLPLQAVLIWWVWKLSRRPGTGSGGTPTPDVTRKSQE